jgi:hypothetical protein
MSSLSIEPTTGPGGAFRFRTRDIVWTLGMCALSLGLAPIAAFYMLLVA